jgi:hypothetical protein
MRSAALKTAPVAVSRVNFEWPAPFGCSPCTVNDIGRTFPSRSMPDHGPFDYERKIQTGTLPGGLPRRLPWQRLEPTCHRVRLDCLWLGTSIDEIATFLCRDVEEVRAKIAELEGERH